MRRKKMFTQKTEEIYDAVLLGWPAFRFVKGLQSEFIQEMIDLDFVEFFDYLLKRSWNPPAKASKQAKQTGISVLYKQIGELIPWLKELIDDDPNDSDNDASIHSPPPSSVVDSDDSDPEEQVKVTLKGNPEAEKNAATLLRVFKSSQNSFCISPPVGFDSYRDICLRWIVMQVAGCTYDCEVTRKMLEDLEYEPSRGTHFRVNIRRWCVEIAKDIREEIHRSPSPEAYSNLDDNDQDEGKMGDILSVQSCLIV
ncbi:hypothetical protein PM082_021220 [Marasmius tenuissimus]|nr:hypothetical protein PM082_021220 [Marasmius tenuissimus]